MGLRGIEKDGTEGEGTKVKMTDHVKDISCHGPLSLLSSHALLLQTCSASSHSTGPFINLCTARVFIHTFFQHFFVTLFRIIFLKYPSNSQINSLPDVLWHKLNLSSLLSIVTVSQIPLHVYNFWYSKKNLESKIQNRELPFLIHHLSITTVRQRSPSSIVLTLSSVMCPWQSLSELCNPVYICFGFGPGFHIWPVFDN